MLRYRLITGPLLIAFLLGIVWLDDRLDTVALTGAGKDLFRGKAHPPSGLALFTLALVTAPLAARELALIFRSSGIRAETWLVTLATVAGLVVSYAVPVETEAITAVAIVATALIAVFVIALAASSRNENTEGVLAAAGATVFAMIYLGLMLGFLLALRRSHSAWLIVGVIFVTKACDTGAYFTGRAVGRHKMIPWLSPGKTWEGLAGGVVTAAALGMLLAWLSHGVSDSDRIPIALGAACGVIFALVGQFGDLTMSLFKRGAGLKDSSSILPGLGGVLDVLDSPLMVAPVAFWMLKGV